MGDILKGYWPPRRGTGYTCDVVTSCVSHRIAHLYLSVRCAVMSMFLLPVPQPQPHRTVPHKCPCLFVLTTLSIRGRSRDMGSAESWGVGGAGEKAMAMQVGDTL